MTIPWQAYEGAARSVLQQIGSVLGIGSVEGKQTLDGKSGTQWEIDAKAIQENGEKFLVVEVRRYTTSSLKQEDVAALAFRIGDVGAVGGVVVSPLPLQRGAELVAKSVGIEHVRLSADSTATDYLAEYMGRRFIGVSVVESANLSDSCDAVVVRGSGNDA
ncbi:hypothetical protein [Rhodoferax sp.]|uniref:hypothetical protein n=1 Tax=Rhodoferax sp. TaxID=50421 RepID=UPI002773E36E|nr:hypothetical protein [Rhodoferax sp.]